MIRRGILVVSLCVLLTTDACAGLAGSDTIRAGGVCLAGKVNVRKTTTVAKDTVRKKQDLWLETIAEQVYVLCKNNTVMIDTLQGTFLGAYDDVIPRWWGFKKQEVRRRIWDAFKAELLNTHDFRDVIAFIQDGQDTGDWEAYDALRRAIVAFHKEYGNEFPVCRQNSMHDVRVSWQQHVNDFFGERVSDDDFVGVFAPHDDPELAVRFYSMEIEDHGEKLSVSCRILIADEDAYTLFGNFKKMPNGGLVFDLSSINVSLAATPYARKRAAEKKFSVGFIDRLARFLKAYARNLSSQAQTETVITLQAARSTGKYLWAQHGFLFDDMKSQAKVLDYLDGDYIAKWVRMVNATGTFTFDAAMEAKLRGELGRIKRSYHGDGMQPSDVVALSVYGLTVEAPDGTVFDDVLIARDGGRAAALARSLPDGRRIVTARELFVPNGSPEHPRNSFGKMCLLSGESWHGVYHMFPATAMQWNALHAGQAYRARQHVPGDRQISASA